MPEGDQSPGERKLFTVLMFIDGLGSGGAQKQFVRLAAALGRRGHRIVAAVYNDLDHFAPDLARAGIPIIRLAKPNRWSPKPIMELARLYRSIGAQAVIAFLRSPAAKAEIARLFHPDMRIVVAERSVYGHGKLPLRLYLSQSMHRLAAYVTVNSFHQQRRMEEELPTLARRVVTIYNSVSLPPKRAPIREAIGEAPRLLVISSLMAYKNSLLLAHAIAALRDEFGITARVSWLGETFENLDDYGAFRVTCSAIADLGLQDQWVWLGVRGDVDEVIAQHDVLIHPSNIEGMSNAVTEAMAMGLPVIAGRIADHTCIVEQTGAGVLFPSFDKGSIARTIATFSRTDRTSRAAMGQAGRDAIAKLFTEDNVVRSYEQVLEAAIDGIPLIPEAFNSQRGRVSCAD